MEDRVKGAMMAGVITKLTAPIVRAVRLVDGALAAGGIANARAAVAEGARRRDLAIAAAELPHGDPGLGQAV